MHIGVYGRIPIPDSGSAQPGQAGLQLMYCDHYHCEVLRVMTRFLYQPTLFPYLCWKAAPVKLHPCAAEAVPYLGQHLNSLLSPAAAAAAILCCHLHASSLTRQQAARFCMMITPSQSNICLAGYNVPYTGFYRREICHAKLHTCVDAHKASCVQASAARSCISATCQPGCASAEPPHCGGADGA